MGKNREKKVKKREKKEKKREKQRQQQGASIKEIEVTDEIKKEEASVIEVSQPMSAKTIIIEISSSAFLHVGWKDNTDLYHGEITSNSTCVGEVSLIPFEDNDDVFNTYNILREGREEFNLEPHWIADGSKIGISKVLLVPRVSLVTSFFEGEYKKLLSTTCETIGFKEWWHHIEGLFKKIFRNVMKGMLVLFPNRYSIGSEVFVSQIEKTGKLIPLPIFQINQDVRLFLRIFSQIINIEGENNINQLPKILKKYFKDLQKCQWNASKSIADVQFCIDCPYFWDSEERIIFLRRLCILCRAFKLFSAIDAILHGSRNYMWADNWKDLVPYGTRYAAILEYMMQDALERGENPKYIYSRPGDIVRYIAAVFHHFNDGLTEEDWSLVLLSFCFPFFPDDLFIRLLGYVFTGFYLFRRTLQYLVIYSFIGVLFMLKLTCNICLWDLWNTGY